MAARSRRLIGRSGVVGCAGDLASLAIRVLVEPPFVEQACDNRDIDGG
jgi:hypothetical protein